MSSETEPGDPPAAIDAQDLGKRYRMYAEPRDRLLEMAGRPLARLLGRPEPVRHREFWALRDVSFRVAPGETLGIVGRNGSGKSTLLRLVCGTLPPTVGRIAVRGRVSALLELGAGFNPEFTGRDNVFLNAAILGLARAEIEARFDSIVAFADIGAFLDRPLKTYSSGMAMRLAFAVAACVDPQVLVIDEALAVGDELFQRKCFARIRSMKEAGATILLVSHAGGAIVDLCDRAMLLEGGERLAIGQPKAIVAHYQKLLHAPEERRAEIRAAIRSSSEGASGDVPSRPSPPDPASFDPHLRPRSTLAWASRGASILEPRILDAQGRLVNGLRRGETYRYTFRVRFDEPARHVRFGMMIKTVTGTELGGATSAALPLESDLAANAGETIEVEFRFRCDLNPATYFLNAGVLGLVDGAEEYLHRVLDACAFRVQPLGPHRSTGFVDFGGAAEIRRIAPSVAAR